MDRDRPPRDFADWIGLRDVLLYGQARWLGAGVGVIVALFLVLALVAAAVVMIRVFDPATGATGNLGAGALIVATLSAPFVIWNTVIKHRALGFQKEGHITDRISKAVEQLGAEKTVKRRETDDDGKPVTVEETVPNIEVRIGALLSLERIAQDSTAYDNGRDHVRVMEILCAYVRENAPARTAKDHPFGEWKPLRREATEEERNVHIADSINRFGAGIWDGKVHEWVKGLPPPREDIALALRVIGRRTPEQRAAEASWGARAKPDDAWVFETPCPLLPNPKTKARLPVEVVNIFKADLGAWQKQLRGYAGYRLDLRNTNLQSADLSELVLSGALFSRARMEGANFREALLTGAEIWDARLDGARLTNARVEGAKLANARMEGASLQGAQLQGADLKGARAEGAVFAMARLEGADLTVARLDNSFLWGARLEASILRRTSLRSINFSGARMDNFTDLTEAFLNDAWVKHVDWSGVRLTADQVASMFGDGSVVLPGGVNSSQPNWPSHWPAWILHDSYFDESPTFDDEYHRWLADPAAYVPPPPPDTPPPS